MKNYLTNNQRFKKIRAVKLFQKPIIFHSRFYVIIEFIGSITNYSTNKQCRMIYHIVKHALNHYLTDSASFINNHSTKSFKKSNFS